MLSSFIAALTVTGAMRKVKRIILVTGAKHYGLQLGAIKNPMQQSDRNAQVHMLYSARVSPRGIVNPWRVLGEPYIRISESYKLSYTCRYLVFFNTS